MKNIELVFLTASHCRKKTVWATEHTHRRDWSGLVHYHRYIFSIKSITCITNAVCIQLDWSNGMSCPWLTNYLWSTTFHLVVSLAPASTTPHCSKIVCNLVIQTSLKCILYFLLNKAIWDNVPYECALIFEYLRSGESIPLAGSESCKMNFPVSLDTEHRVLFKLENGKGKIWQP